MLLDSEQVKGILKASAAIRERGIKGLSEAQRQVNQYTATALYISHLVHSANDPTLSEEEERTGPGVEELVMQQLHHDGLIKTERTARSA